MVLKRILTLILRIILRVLKIMLIYIGAFVGKVSVFLVMAFFVTMGGEEAWFFLVLSVVMMVQISFLTLVTWGLAKLANVRLFSSFYHNFAIGFLFSLIYDMLLSIIDQVEFLSKIGLWFDFVILPIIIFLLLIYIDYLLLSRK